MANILALISKAGFKNLCEEFGEIEVGGLTAVKQYVSANKRLEKLSSGGSLFLATVRDSELWLVAILENPTFKTDKWVAAPNEFSTTVISDIVPDLRFDNGKGLTTPPEKWAMSLQTPRALTVGDVALLRNSGGAPSPNAAFREAMVRALPEEPRTKRLKKKGSERAAGTRSGEVPWTEGLASPEQWSALDDDAKSHVAIDLLNALNKKYKRAFALEDYRCGVNELAAYRHLNSDAVFVAVPGGQFVMGFSVDDINAVNNVLDSELQTIGAHFDSYATRFRWARPPRVVTVQPFLVERGMESGVLETDDSSSLISEAQWEWVAREGGASRFVNLPADAHPLGPTVFPPTNDTENAWGVQWLLNDEQLTADAWHENYVGAPTEAKAWGKPSGRRVIRMGHTWWQSESEAVALSPANRIEGDYGVSRACFAMPAKVDVPTLDIDWSKGVESLLADLRGSKTAARTRALVCVAALAHTPGPDSRELFAALARAIPSLHKKSVLGVVCELAEYQSRVDADDLVDVPLTQTRAYLKHKDAKLRANASRLLAFGPASNRKSLVSAFKTEKSELDRASLAAAIVTLGMRHGDDLDLEQFWNDPSEWVQGAVTLCTLSGQFDQDELDRLAIVAGLEQKSVLEFPWFDGDLSRHVRERIQLAPKRARHRAWKSLAPVMIDDQNARRSMLLEVLGEVDDRSVPLYLKADELSDLQRIVATAVSERALSWAEFENVPIPKLLEDRRVWLGLDPPGAFEIEVTLAKKRVPFWRALRHLVREGLRLGKNQDAFDASFQPIWSQLTSAQQVGVLMEEHRFFWMRTHIHAGGTFKSPDSVPDFETALLYLGDADFQAARDLAMNAMDRVRTLQGLNGNVVRIEKPLQVLNYVLGDDESLPLSCLDAISFHQQFPYEILERVPVAELEPRTFAAMSLHLESVTDTRYWPIAKFATEHYGTLAEFSGSERVFRGFLALAIAGGSEFRSVAVKTLRSFEHPMATTIATMGESIGPIESPAGAKDAVEEIMAPVV